MPHSNSWLIRRDVNEMTIVVQAHEIPKQNSWGLTCKVNGQLVDHRQADDPLAEGVNMINAAILDNEREDTHAPQIEEAPVANKIAA